MTSDSLKLIYNTTSCQTISSCGEYLFAGNNFGEIFVFCIPEICADPNSQINPNGNLPNRPHQVFKAIEDGTQIQSLAFHNDFLIVGTIGLLSGYSWVKNRLTKKSWEIRLSPLSNNQNQEMDVNCLHMDAKNDNIFVGCGDNSVYAIKLEAGQVLRSFNGHTDYIHCIDLDSENKLFSASEDGTINFWDQREKQAVNRLEPFKNERLARPQFGKWQGAVAVTDDWLICGGGTAPGLWHLRSMECTTAFNFIRPVRVAGFLDDSIYIGGDYNQLCHFSMKGEIIAEIPVSSPSIYSVVAQNKPEKFLSIAGSSNSLDICTDFHFRDIVLSLYPSQKSLKENN